MASTDSSLPSAESITGESGSVIFRRGLLHPFGVSLFIIVEKACSKAQDVDGAMGSVTKKMAAFLKSALPFIYALQYQCLLWLSFVDDHIIVVVNMLTTIFPPSKRLFNKIDDSLVDAVETLPAKFDNAMRNFLRRRSSNEDTREKEIKVVDIINCDHEINNSLERSSSALVLLESQTNMKCSYKEILEKGEKQSAEKKEEEDSENPETYFSTDEADQDKDGNGSSNEENMIVSEDPILELFEASWHMNPTKGTSFPTHSYSFI